MIGILVNSYLAARALEHDDIKYEKHGFIMIVLFNLSGTAVGLAYCICRSDYEAALYIITTAWIFMVAYVDRMSCYIYECMEYYAVVIVIAGISGMYSDDMALFMSRLVVNLIMVCVIYAGTLAGFYGDGDCDVLSVVCVVAAKPVIVICLCYMSTALFAIRYIADMIKHRGETGRIRPFVPSIYMGYVIITVCRIMFFT